jgi:hypothetical protein
MLCIYFIYLSLSLFSLSIVNSSFWIRRERERVRAKEIGVEKREIVWKGETASKMFSQR